MRFNEFDPYAFDPDEIVAAAEAIVYEKYMKITEPLWKRAGWLILEFFEPAGRIVSGVTYPDNEEY